ncbi:hypothetical protein V3C99_018622 [Haemonchus contortus]|uniref:T2SSF domain-containing protein n=1 Tax=Haemonchus contortus TaxID=6289 RepID=A0A7I4Z0Z6_HAECO
MASFIVHDQSRDQSRDRSLATGRQSLVRWVRDERPVARLIARPVARLITPLVALSVEEAALVMGVAVDGPEQIARSVEEAALVMGAAVDGPEQIARSVERPVERSVARLVADPAHERLVVDYGRCQWFLSSP